MVQDEKRQLETELVVEQQLSGQSVRGGPRLGDSAEERSEEVCAVSARLCVLRRARVRGACACVEDGRGKDIGGV